MNFFKPLRYLGCAAALLVAALAGCTGQQSGTLASGGNDGAVLERTEYTLGSGDRLRVVVFRHEDLSGEFALDGGGSFAMPLIGQVDASGMTTRDLERQIESQLSEGYLVDPKVTIEVLNYRPFYILGEVNQPGQYEYVNGMTVLNAIALAGGFTYRADQDDIAIKRGGSNASAVTVGGTQEILPGDIIQVPERFF